MLVKREKKEFMGDLMAVMFIELIQHRTTETMRILYQRYSLCYVHSRTLTLIVKSKESNQADRNRRSAPRLESEPPPIIHSQIFTTSIHNPHFRENTAKGAQPPQALEHKIAPWPNCGSSYCLGAGDGVQPRGLLIMARLPGCSSFPPWHQVRKPPLRLYRTQRISWARKQVYMGRFISQSSSLILKLNLAHLPLNPASIPTKKSRFNGMMFPFPEPSRSRSI